MSIFFRMFFFLPWILSSYELSVLAMFREESKYLKEWIDYHRIVGVEHFWLYNDHSTDNFYEVLKEYVDTGIVEVIDWTTGGCEWNFLRQPGIYVDGLKKAIGKTKWLAILDLDEFLIPMRDQTVTECLEKHYKEATEIYVNYRHFGTSKVTVPEGESMLYHLTSCSLKGHPRNLVGKCIVRPECVILEKVWTPHYFELKHGGKFFNGSGELIPYEFETRKEAALIDFSTKVSDKLLRVNHYMLRDESFFWNRRYARTGDKELLMEQYENFLAMKDYSIMRFVKKLYPQHFQE